MIGIPFFAKNRPRMIASGGTVTTVGYENVHTFTSTGTFSCMGRGYIQVLVVGGGGNGGNGGYAGGSTWWNGAGGKGGYVSYTSKLLCNPTPYTITVGSAGNNSVAFGITATASAGANGGAQLTNGDGTTTGSNGTSNSISGTAYVYGSGAGSGYCCWSNTGIKNGGAGGTGAGRGGCINMGDANYIQPEAGTNYGAGGGGGAVVGLQATKSNGASGKAGVVIIRYLPI